MVALGATSTGSRAAAVPGDDFKDSGIAGFHHTAWHTSDGAPPDIWALAQAPQGFLWLASGAGLFRFDGLAFEGFHPAPGESLLSSNLTALLQLPSGDLWIGYYNGGVSLLHAGHLTHYAETDGVPLGAVVKFEQGSDGAIWMAARRGLGRFDGTHWQRVDETWNYPALRADWIMRDRLDTLWVATGSSLVYLPRASRSFVDTGTPIGKYAVLAESADGGVWISDTLAGTRRLASSGASTRLAARPSAVANIPAKRLLFDRAGALWGTDADRGGVFHLADAIGGGDAEAAARDANLETFTTDQGLTANVAGPILLDRENNIWVGTNLGLNRFRRNSFSLLAGTQAQPRMTFSLAGGSGAPVWIIGGGVLSTISHGQRSSSSVAQPFFAGICNPTDGSLWLIAPDTLARTASAGLTQIPYPAASGQVMALAADGDARLWLSMSDEGLWSWADGAWTRQNRMLPILAAPTAIAAADGTKWFGFVDGRVVEQVGATATSYGVGEGLDIGAIITVTAAEHEVWVGGERGLAQFRHGRFVSLAPVDQDAFTRISGIRRSTDGDLWFNGNRGAVRIRKNDLDHALENPTAQLDYRLFDYNDGFAGVALQTQPASTLVRDDEGRLWFATNRGIASIDPAQTWVNEVPPVVSVRALSADGVRYPPASELTLPERTTNMRIDYSALSLTNPERIRFRYRLDGVDKSWQDVGSQTAAAYANLSPGAYVFHVIAANSDGVWNREGASVSFYITPRFTQTRTFFLLFAGSIFTAIGLAYYLRMRQIAADFTTRLTERLNERERIARELHDTLLQSVQGLVLLLHAIAQQLPKSEKLRAAMDGALDRADEVLAEGRDRVRDLRTSAETVSDLPAAFSKVAQEMDERHDVAFNVVTQGNERELPCDVREEVYRIGREAILNAFRHSQADKVELELSYDAAQLRLSIRDNGIGIEPAKLNSRRRAGHWGMAGMQERAAKLGGVLKVWAAEGSGTEIELILPAKAAYGSESPSWFARVARWSRRVR